MLVLKDGYSPRAFDTGAPSGGLASKLEQVLREVGRRPVANVTPMWNDLIHGKAPLNTGMIDTPIPAWWPHELRAEWETGRAVCLAKAGSRPYDMGNLSGYLCGLQIAPIFWQKWLDHLHADHVVIVEVSRTNPNDPKSELWNVETSSYEPGSFDDFRLFRGEIQPGSVPDAAVDMALRSFNGEGRVIRRTLEREMPDSPLYHALPAAAIPNDGIPVASIKQVPSPNSFASRP